MKIVIVGNFEKIWIDRFPDSDPIEMAHVVEDDVQPDCVINNKGYEIRRYFISDDDLKVSKDVNIATGAEYLHEDVHVDTGVADEVISVIKGVVMGKTIESVETQLQNIEAQVKELQKIQSELIKKRNHLKKEVLKDGKESGEGKGDHAG